MTPMRVLHLGAGNLYGGVETLLIAFARCRQLCPEMEPHFALCFEGRLSRELALEDVPVHLLNPIRISRPWTASSGRRALHRLLGDGHFDAVVTHMCWPHMIFGPVVLAHTPNLIYWAHSGGTGHHWTERWASMTKPAIVIANSRFVAGTTCRLFGPVRAEVVHYPVPCSREAAPRRSRSEIRRELGAPETATVIIQVSRMEKWKGHTLHLDALARLKEIPDWICWIVGGAQRPSEDAYLAGLQRRARERGIADRVFFLGQRADVPSLLGAADIFCQPNLLPEPFGIVFVEALSAGLPVISTAWGGPMEIINDSCGVLVPPDEPRALADALRQCIQDPDLRRCMSRNGPARARELCNPETQLRRLYSVFKELVSQTTVPLSCATPMIQT